MNVAVTSSQPGGTVDFRLSGAMSNDNYTVKLTNASNPNQVYTGTVSSGSSKAMISVPVGIYTATVTSPNGYAATLNLVSVTVTDGSVLLVKVNSYQVEMVTVTVTNTSSSIAPIYDVANPTVPIYSSPANSFSSFSVPMDTRVKVVNGINSAVFMIEEPGNIYIPSEGPPLFYGEGV